MAHSARRRPGTSPSFWRRYHHAQFMVAASSMRSAVSGIVRKPGLDRMKHEYHEGPIAGVNCQ